MQIQTIAIGSIDYYVFILFLKSVLQFKCRMELYKHEQVGKASDFGRCQVPVTQYS